MINVLALAQQLIPPTDIIWMRHEGRGLNSIGQWVSVFSDPIDIMGNFQPVQRDKYEFQGLDLAKSYWNLYTQNDVKGLKDSGTADRVAHHGRLYDIVGVTPWYGYDGWNHALCVDIGEYVAPPIPPIPPEDDDSVSDPLTGSY
jgi:hypothetical protein